MNILSPLGDPIGRPVAGWQPAQRPLREDANGRWCALEALTPDEHAAALYDAYGEDGEGRIWTYLPYGPFDSLAAFTEWLEAIAPGEDPMFFAIRDASDGRIGGLGSYLRINPEMGSIEIGHLNFSPRLQKKQAATEALHLMIRRAFALGYRRCEWKCDALNAGSRRAAARLGFTFEGIHRQAAVVKGRNRDTAWFSILDRDWPALQQAHEAWLADDNFDAQGRQAARLSALTSPLNAARGGDASF
ncbi:MAG: GNAT family protein [Pseudomonadota bacterium]